MNFYGTLREYESSPPFTAGDEPLTVETVKEFLNLPVLSPVDDDKDIELDRMIVAARERAEQKQNRDIKLKQWRLSLDFWPCEIPLGRDPLVSVILVRYRDEDGDWHTLTEGTDYIVDLNKEPGIILPASDAFWPTAVLWPSSPIEIYFTAGFSDVTKIPKHILQGMLAWVSIWFNDKLPTGTAEEGGRQMRMADNLLSQGGREMVG